MNKFLEIFTLGGLSIEIAGKEVTGLASRKAAALFVYLACTGKKHTRDHLANLFWDERTQSQAMGNLSVLLSSLRKKLSPFLIIDRQNIAFSFDSQFWLDTLALESGIDRWKTEIGNPQRLSADSLEKVDEYLGIYNGEFLNGFHVRNCRGFNDWLLLERERLHLMVIDVLEELVTIYLKSGLFTKGIKACKRLLNLDPLHEGAHRQLMILFEAKGQRTTALAHYETMKTVLQEELAVDPSDETKEVYRKLIKGEPLEGSRGKTINYYIPASPTKLIGRNAQIEELEDQINQKNNRSLTLVGVGGIGKTRLAMELARRSIGKFPDGVWFVELAPVNDPDLLVDQVASIFGITAQENKRGRDILNIMIDYLEDKELLLVLDNCEHLVEACAHFADVLLKGCPKLKMISTSREELGFSGEVLYRVPTLDLPIETTEQDDLESVPAIKLFLERARQSRNSFELSETDRSIVTKICNNLDGIPLAIELAAARVKVLSLSQIWQRLQDRFDLLIGGPKTALARHQTLEATMDWSYGLLSKDEQTLFRELSIFVGGWDLEAAEHVSNTKQKNKKYVLGLLSQLVAKSLVQTEDQSRTMRFSMLETVRQYGQKKLSEVGEAKALNQRYFIWASDLAENADLGLRNERQIISLETLDQEHDNIRAALQWAIREGKQEYAFRMIAAIGWYWFMRGYWKEAKDWLGKSLRLGSDGNTSYRSKAIVRAAGIELIRGKLDENIELIEESLEISRRLDDRETIAWCLNILGQSYTYKSGEELAKAIPLLDESIEIFRSLGIPWGIAWGTRYIGQVFDLQDDHQKALALQKEALKIFDDLQDHWNCAHSLYLLGNSSHRHHEYEYEGWTYQEGLAKSMIVDDKVMYAHCLRGLGEIALKNDELGTAAELLEDAYEALTKIGDDVCVAVTALGLGELSRQKGDFKGANNFIKESILNFHMLGHEQSLLSAILRMAILSTSKGQNDKNIQLLAFVDAWTKKLDLPPKLFSIEEIHELITESRNKINIKSFDQLYDQGTSLNIEQAIQLALDQT